MHRRNSSGFSPPQVRAMMFNIDHQMQWLERINTLSRLPFL